MGYGTLLNVMLRFFKYLDSFLSVHYTINLLILNLKRLYDTRPRGTRWVPSPQRAVAGACGVQRHTHTFHLCISFFCQDLKQTVFLISLLKNVICFAVCPAHFQPSGWYGSFTDNQNEQAL